MLKSGSEKAGGTAGIVGSLPQRLWSNRTGTVSMLFGLLIIPLTAVVGLAVDFGRVYAVKAHTQAALDAAALAAGRVAQLPASTNEKTSAAATAFFNQTKPTGVVTSSLQFSPNAEQTEFTVTATSWIRTPFLGVLHVLNHKGSEAGAPPSCVGNHYGCVKVTTTATAALCPSAACVGNSSGENVEVSLMLDVTGSMCSPCSKIDALKLAAKDLIDIVVWQYQGYSSKVALAPFAAAVNVGTALAPQVRGTVTANAQSNPQNFTSSSVLNNTSNQPTNQWIRFSSVNNSNSGGCSSSSNQCTWRISSKCVTERTGTQAYTDAPPTTAFVGKAYFGTNADTSCVVANFADPEINSILPLSADKAMLKSRIDKLTTGGSTAGHLGTAWAWYLLSPNWGYLYPTASRPGPYSDVIDPRPDKPKTGTLRKVAVLMTDGEYNINYCKGVEAKNSDQSPDINCNSENGKSLTQAASLCTAMKNSKIEVYTVGFQVNSTAKTFLTNCASGASHYCDASSEDALKQCFRDIALNIAKLRLTN